MIDGLWSIASATRASAVVPTVPTRVLRACGDSSEAAAAAFAAAAASLGSPNELVTKPAVGTRGDGVERLSRGEGCPVWLLPLLCARDYLLQPFLPEVARRGEVCLVFVNGELLHAVHKDPAGWGGDEAGVADVGNAADAARRRSPSTPDPCAPAAPAAPATATAAATSCAAAPAHHPSFRQCVRRLSPPPAALVATARRALRVVAARCGGDLYLARVDLLPTASGTWLVSELELGWPELFLRANPAAADRVAAGVLRYLPPGRLTPCMRAAQESWQDGR